LATALQLVNRVRRKLRWGDTTAFTDDQSLVALDAVNAALALVFEGWDWDCDVRHDGVLLTFADETLPTITVTNSSTDISDATDTELANAIATADDRRACLRFLVEADSTVGDVAGRIAWGWYNTSTFTGYATLDSAYLGTSGSVSMRVIANQYGLPTTVRKVLSVTHQGTNVRLEEIQRTQVFDRMVQRPHETVSDMPSVVAIGGTVAATVRSSNATSAPDTPSEELYPSMLIYPTPSTAYQLNYSYLVQRSALTATTDTVTNLTRTLEDAITDLAFARCMSDVSGEFDPEAGLALEERTLRRVQKLHANQYRDTGRRRVLGSNFCQPARGVNFGALPRNFGSL
jgi:hypothetical protein